MQSAELLHLFGGAFLAVLHPTCLIFVDLSVELFAFRRAFGPANSHFC